MELRGRVTLLTGASRGLGVVIARRLARRGARLALMARDAEALEALAADLRRHGCEAHACPCDVTDGESCLRAVADVRRRLGPPQVLINNAGVDGVGPLEQMAFSTIYSVVDVNLLGPLRLIHAVLPDMLASRSGHVVLLGSLAGSAGLPYASTYAATKAAVAVLAHSLRMECRSRGVSASVVMPGFVEDTGMFADQQASTRGLPEPLFVGTARASAVASAVTRAVERDVPEIIVNGRPLRAALAVGRLWPGLASRIVVWSCGRYMETLAASRRTRAGGESRDEP